MFQALFLQERDAMRDLIARKNNTLKSRESKASEIGVRTRPDVTNTHESKETMIVGKKVGSK
jgi:hypothetical protein